MFAYSDPTGTDALTQMGGLPVYQALLNAQDQKYGCSTGSSYVVREAFASLAACQQAQTASVKWAAFPKRAVGTNDEIDASRDVQDEYVEWHVEKDAWGKVARVTFTTEFFTFYEALASVSMGALIWAIQQVIPGANPAAEELFGPDFNPDTSTPEERMKQLVAHCADNPWNNGTKGILFLMQRSNNLHALFDLTGDCAIARPERDTSSICAMGNCEPARNSDPNVCQAVQLIACAKNGLSLQDPVGVRITDLTGIWKVDGRQVDINDPADNGGVWTVSRNGRRGVLELSKNVTMGDDPITSGAQIATALEVAADVIYAPMTFLPVWAKSGQPDMPHV